MKPVSKPHAGHYLPGIDGLRALAVLAVMVFHLDDTLLPGGFAGVDVFFVISGYVVSRAMLGREIRSAGHFMVDFFARRFVRILPALLVCLTLVSLLSVLFIPQSWLSSTIADVGVWAYFGASNIALLLFQDGYFSPRAEFNPFTHTWSLGVEEQFYLVLPPLILLWAAWGRGRGVGPAAARLVLPVLALLSLATAYWLGRENPPAAYYLLPSRFWELAAGVSLYLWQHQRPAAAEGSTPVQAGLVPGLALIALGFWFADGAHFPYPWALLPVVGTVLCIHAIAVTRVAASPSLRLLSHPLLVYTGKLSYSLYLWHWPVYALFRWTLGLDGPWVPLAVAVTFACAALSYHAVEQPVRNSRWLRRQPPLAKVLAGLLLVAGGLAAAAAMFDRQHQLSLSVTRDAHTWYPHEYGIENPAPGDLPLAGKKLFVVGNSHTGAYATMLREAADRLGVEVTRVQMGHCNLGSVMINNVNDPQCIGQIEAVMADIERTLAPGDVVFLASLRTYRLIDQWAVFDYGSVLSHGKTPFSPDHPLLKLGQAIGEIEDPAAWPRDTDGEILGFDNLIAFSRSAFATSRRKLALDESRDIVRRLTEKGYVVLIDAPKPVFQFPPYRCADWFNRANPICALGPRVAREALLELREPIMGSLSTLAAEFDDVVIWDPFPVLCPGEVCSAFDSQGVPLFFDGDHLSAHGNRVLYPHFEQLLRTIWRGEGSRQPATPSSATGAGPTGD